MAIPWNGLHQVEPLTESQIAQFKRDGMLVLPGVLDLDLCRQARDQMWALIAAHRPSMKRDDPTTWLPFTEAEADSYARMSTSCHLDGSPQHGAACSVQRTSVPVYQRPLGNDGEYARACMCVCVCVSLCVGVSLLCVGYV